MTMGWLHNVCIPTATVRLCLSVVVAVAFVHLAGAQEGSATGPAQPPQVPAAISEQRDRWVKEVLGWVESVLRENPPGSGKQDARKLALLALDGPIHLGDDPVTIAPLGEFLHRLLSRAVEQIASEQITDGATIWKMYNSFFVVRTPHHTIAFDLNRGPERWGLTEAQLRRLAGQVEVLFITHTHEDHIDLDFARMMVAAGKRVVVPTGLWADTDLAPALTFAAGGDQGAVSTITYQVFPGGQLEQQNNVYLVTADGISAMHTGDEQQYGGAAKWIAEVGKQHHVDLLFPNCWTPDLADLIATIKPQLTITAHENELYHALYERESYAKTYDLLHGVNRPYLVMTWGERFHYTPASKGS